MPACWHRQSEPLSALMRPPLLPRSPGLPEFVYVNQAVANTQQAGFKLTRGGDAAVTAHSIVAPAPSARVEGQIIGESFRECLGGYAACGLLRENFHRLSAHSLNFMTVAMSLIKCQCRQTLVANDVFSFEKSVVFVQYRTKKPFS